MTVEHTWALTSGQYESKFFSEVVFVIIMSFSVVLVVRLFFLLFDQNFEMATLQASWQNDLEFISPTNLQENWYLKNKSTYGSIPWIGIRVAVVSSVMGIVGFIFQFLVFDKTAATQIVISIVWAGFLIAMGVWFWMLLPKQEDSIFLRSLSFFSANNGNFITTLLRILVLAPTLHTKLISKWDFSLSWEK